MPRPAVRIRIDFQPGCAVGPGKIGLLEAIARTGSLSQAARELGMSYRRAWQLVADFNLSFRRPVVSLSTGGRGGGGARLTAFGGLAVSTFRRLEAQCTESAATTLAQLARAAIGEPSDRLPRRPLQKTVLAQPALARAPRQAARRRQASRLG